MFDGIEIHALVALMAAAGAAIVAAAGEVLHARRVGRVARLAFGPSLRPAIWARGVPALRVVALGALAWGLTTLLLLEPRVQSQGESEPDSQLRHVVLVIDVSPSMQLEDAGQKRDKSRRHRAAEVIKSLFDRIPATQYKTSVVACYNGAKPVVLDTRDRDVIHNILDDLPMQYAFQAGETDLFAGLEEAARIAHPFEPHSTTMILVSDGDTVPATGMPSLPASIANVLVVGVGDSQAGSFIDGRNSRQDVSTLRQIAVRLRGTYHNGNEQHVATSVLQKLAVSSSKSRFERLTRREYALLASAFGALVIAFVPVLLHFAGTSWRPGVRRGESSRWMRTAGGWRRETGAKSVNIRS